jgi:hypothetical protein
MRLNYFYAILFLFMPVILLCQTENWIYRYNGPANSENGAISVTYGGDGNIYTAGYLWGLSYNMEFAMIGLNQIGNAVAYHLSGSTLANSLAWGSDGYIYVTGFRSTGSTGNDILTKRLTLSGTQSWYRTYDGSASGSDIAYEIACGTGNAVYVAGYSTSTSTGFDFTVLKYSQSGVLLWDFTYDAIDHLNDVANSIIVATDGNIYAAGHGSYNSMNDCIIISLTADGDTNWVYHYNGPSNANDHLSDLTYDNATTLYAACTSVGWGTDTDFTIISLGTLGIEETQFDTNNYRVHAIITSPNPCRNSTMIFSNRYVVNEYVELSLYDNLGRYIETIYSGITPIHGFAYHPPQELDSGVYQIVLKTKKEQFTKSLIIIR